MDNSIDNQSITDNLSQLNWNILTNKMQDE